VAAIQLSAVFLTAKGKREMENQHILTPYFLDEQTPGLRPLAKDQWQVISAELPVTSSPSSDRPPAERQRRMSILYRPLRDAVAEAVSQGRRPVSVAGDCCTTLAVFAGLQKAGVRPSLLWFDAHGDFNTWETTPSGFLGGMPLAMMVGRGEQTLPQSVDLQVVPESDIMLTDARDLDPGERTALEDSVVNVALDPATLINGPLPEGPLYVHFDSDILNPTEAPAMSYLAAGGPPSEVLRQVFKRLAGTDRLIAVSLSAWNPEMDADGRSRELVMSLLDELVA
jgi:arginase